MDKYNCPCCGCLTLSSPPPGSFDICPVCLWEDDRAQFNDPLLCGGANRLSLKNARENYTLFGVSEPSLADRARAPLPDELPEVIRSEDNYV